MVETVWLLAWALAGIPVLTASLALGVALVAYAAPYGGMLASLFAFEVCSAVA